MVGHKEVLRVVQIGVQAILNTVDDPGLQVDQDSPRYVVLIVRLIEEHIFTIVTVRCVLLQDALTADTVLQTKLLPELVTD